MKFYKIFAIALMAFTFNVSAGGLPSYVGNIKSILVGKVYDSKVLIEVDRGNTSINNQNTFKTNCSSQQNPVFGFALDTSTEAGKMYLSLLLTAYAANKNVVITGYADCNIQSGVIDFRSIQMK